jgi:endoglucanase
MVQSLLRRSIIAAGMAAAASPAFSLGRSVSDKSPAKPLLKKGINLSDWFQYSRKSKPSRLQLEGLREIGVDHVRLPVDPSTLEWRPDASESDLILTRFSELDDAVYTVLGAGLILNLDFHPGQESNAYLKKNPQKAEAVITRCLKALISRYARFSENQIVFELVNEPHRFFNERRISIPGADTWSNVQGRLIGELRKVTDKHWFIANGVWDPLSTFRTLSAYPDPRILYSFHFYKPYVVTHQGATWEPSAARLFPYLENVPYPSNLLDDTRHRILPGGDEAYIRSELAKYRRENWDIVKLRSEMEVSLSWAKANHVPIICTEFGMLRKKVDSHSRVRWLSDVISILEENDVPWTLWDYCSEFGVARCGPHPTVMEPEIAQALGLKTPA